LLGISNSANFAGAQPGTRHSDGNRKVIKLTNKLEPKTMAKNGSWVKSKEGWTTPIPASSRSFSGLKPGANNLKTLPFRLNAARNAAFSLKCLEMQNPFDFS
jgi:hypothetical protein